MKKLLVVSVVALVAVLGLSLYATKVMGDFHRRDLELRDAETAAADKLIATDERFPYEARPGLDAARFPVWLEVRKALATAFAAREAARATNAFHARETRIELLGVLEAALVERKMGFSEYRATAARWRALLARPAFADLQRTWRAATATPKQQPEGLPLPPPAAAATEKEIELLRRYARLLEESMEADLLGPLLDGIGPPGP